MKVLVIDDAATVRHSMVALLGDIPGIALVLEAPTLAVAGELLRAHAPNIVVLDLHLRGESGMAFVPNVKRERPGALVIVLTNDPSDQHRRECVSLGADHFFDKSRDLDDVLRVVAEASAGA